MDDYKQQIIELYNRRTAYDSEENTRHPRDANLLLESVPLHSGQKVLDIATGTGLVAIPAAVKVNSGFVIGVDISEGMLHQARLKIEAACLENIQLIQTDANYINFSDESFDVIFCCEGIIWLTDIPRSLHSFYRFLKPDGFIAFTCPPETAYMASIYKNICTKVMGISIPHILEPLGTPQRCENLLEQIGFRNIEIKVESFGRYREVKNNELSRKGINLNFQGNPLVSNLSKKQFEEFQIEYKAEINKLATDKGIWEETTIFFVRAQK